MLSKTPKELDKLVHKVLKIKERQGVKYEKDIIRLANKFSTIPNYRKIKISYVSNTPNGLLIIPGIEIKIGQDLIARPILAIFVQRFAIEWQIWYECAVNYENRIQIANLASSLVIVSFYNLLPESDKLELKLYLPQNIIKIIDDTIANSKNIDSVDFSFLKRYHNQDYVKNKIDKRVYEIISILAKPTEEILMSGGDTRLYLDKDKLLNMYGCRPFPRLDALSFSSSTATSISNYAFEKSQNYRIRIIKEAFETNLSSTYNKIHSYIINQLLNLIKVKDRNIFLAPSGTDIALYFAGLLNDYNKGKLIHILVGSDETGSGVSLALQGRHFASLTAKNIIVEKEALINGFHERKVVNITIKKSNGELKMLSDIESEIIEKIKQIINDNMTPVLHIIDQSKLGFKAPSFEFIKKLSLKFNMIFQLDNSQMRMSKANLKKYLNIKSCFITITGSKFFTGPPFSGALIFPSNYKSLLNECEMPSGLKDYFSLYSYHENNMNNSVDNYNFGMSFRWYAAIQEINRYEKVPSSLKLIASLHFNNYVENIIKSCDFLEYLETKNNVDKNIDIKTIHPFYVKKNNVVLTFEECTTLYRLLNEDISLKIYGFSSQDKLLAIRKCHIGQPVKVGHITNLNSAVVRINFGSRIISDSWKVKNANLFFHEIEKQLYQIDMIINKIDLIIRNWNILSKTNI